MTISSTNRKAGPYTGNDITVDFPFSFKVFTASDLYVVQANEIGDETVLALTTDYTVTLNADQNSNPGGTIALLSALATGLSLTVTSSLEYLQATDLTNNGGFYPKVITNALDRLTIFVQQLAEQISRSLKYSITSPLGDAALPTPVANTVIGWNSTANGFQNYAPVDNTLLSASLAAPSGSLLVGYQPAGTGADATDVQSKLRESVSVKDFGAVGDGVTDDTVAIQAAIDHASTNKILLTINPLTYNISPATLLASEAGNLFAGLVLKSNLHIIGTGATFRIRDNLSSNASPIMHAMFFSNEVLNDISIDGLTMDMNGQNNPINHVNLTNAALLFSGTPGGVAASGTDVTIQNCKIKNVAGVTCIGMAQTNTVGATLGKRWKILNNVFENVGIDSGDHSSIFGWATDVEVRGNVFTNPAPFNSVAHTGGLVACEIHGSNAVFTGNRINNYYQGLWIGTNLTEDFVGSINIFGNTAKIGCCFTDFYSANLPWGGEANERPIQLVNIYGNTIEIDNSGVADAVKAFFKIAARRQPKFVSIYGNTCRSYETTKNTVLALLIVGPDQLATAEYISIRDNVAAGLNTGLVCFFGGTGAALDVASVEFSNNKLGTLLPSPGGLYQNVDVTLYGPSAGKVEALRVAGLETIGTSPIVTDSHVGGRARVFGKTLLPTSVTWNGLTLVDSSVTSRVSIDTDQSLAHISTLLIVGSTATFTGNIYPSWAGIIADSSASGCVSHVKAGAAMALPSLVFSAANAVSIYTPGGTPLDSSVIAIGSYLAVSASVPTRYADI